MITLIIASFTVSILYVLFSAIRNLGEAQARLESLREDMERRQKQAEVMVENRTPDDAVDRLDDGSF